MREHKYNEDFWLEPTSQINYQIYKDAVITAYILLTGKMMTVDQELKIAKLHENNFHPDFAASELSMM